MGIEQKPKAMLSTGLVVEVQVSGCPQAPDMVPRGQLLATLPLPLPLNWGELGLSPNTN